MANNHNQKQLMDQYQRTRADIASLLDWFDCELNKTTEQDINWATLGTLNHVRHELKQLLASLSGIDVKLIEESLDEINS